MNNKKHGGKRIGAGRKKLNPLKKKVRITVWPMNESVKKVGGEDAAKILALKAIEKC